MYIDAHCHLADQRLDRCRAAMLRHAAACHIDGFIQGGVGPEDWDRQLALRDERWFPTFGLHPWWVADHDQDTCDAALTKLPHFLKRGAVALGETGLDFFDQRLEASFDRQRKMFDAQLEIARELDMPVVLHLVACHGEAPARLARLSSKWRGIVHGFTGSLETARTYLKFGLKLSIGGAVVRPGYKKLKNALSQLSPEDYVVESDAPDQAPTPHRSVVNGPGLMWITAGAIAELQGHSVAEAVLKQSTQNLRQIFALE